MITEAVYNAQVGDKIKIKNFAPAFDGCKGDVFSRDGDYVYAKVEVEGDILEIELYDYELEKLEE